LSPEENEKLLNLLKRHRKVIGYSINAPIILPLDWSQPFEIMFDASDYVVGAVLVKERKAEFTPFTTLVKLLMRHN
jgi:hypothetical protein